MMQSIQSWMFKNGVIISHDHPLNEKGRDTSDLPHPLLWEPTYRGRMSKEVGPPGQTVKADYDTINSFGTWVREHRLRGLPPWVMKKRWRANSPVGTAKQAPLVGVSRSSWTLRQWADDYCQSQLIFKEFVYKKPVSRYKVAVD
ncbi:hypothetical protein EI94DRAFT_1789575 [Lactarius quietus]|nr:hypothetical protein EI94DRAFT_1789575 [Lactarius quietus]